MRLWSLHPKYLDPAGLVALWREALLAQAVLGGRTRGYTKHPQLDRFREHPRPEAVLRSYMQEVYRESVRRGYSFDSSKIEPSRSSRRIRVTKGQLLYEWQHLQAKLEKRDPAWLAGLGRVRLPEPHPIFIVADGPMATWERMTR